MAKSKKPKAKGKGKDPQEPTAPSSGSARPSSTARITVKDVLEEPPSDDSSASSEMPPESEWDEQALLLKQKIESGVFDHFLDRTPKRRKQSKGDVVDEDEEDSSSIEEVDLDDEDERSSSQGEESEEEQMDSGEEEVDSDDGSLEAPEGDASDEEAQEGDEGNEEDGSSEDEKETSNQKDDDEEDESSDEEEESHDNDDRATRLSKKNHISSKALHVVTESLQARKREWPWAETFDVVSSDPLPFDRKLLADDDDAAQEVVDVHDDLKREVAFYDMALAAVARARQLCSAAKIPFSRPEDFFAEMVKTDDHMAKVKDRLIFETKKMDAVAQRKSNKEHKLRAKETQANKAAEKAKRKREHFASLDDWATSSAAKRGRRALDDGEDEDRLRSFGQGGGGRSGNSNKRLAADKKFGFGGKKGRFKQNDRKTLNDTSSFNPRGGSFSGGKKKVSAHKAGGSGGGSNSNKRPGKRARDAKRSQR